MDHQPDIYAHWIRQSDRVYQLTRMARSNEELDLVIATGCKSSIQKLVAALAEQQGPDRYRVTCFEHPTLPGDGALRDGVAALSSGLGPNFQRRGVCVVDVGEKISR
jgi:hypothetical protein